VDVVFTDNTLWQINLSNPLLATQITSNVNYVAIGVHGTGASAVEADYVAFNDTGSTNGGVWEHYVRNGATTWQYVTSLDAYSISASQDLSDTADLILSSQHATITDHSAWAWRGTANTLTPICTDQAVAYIAVNAVGNDFYVLQSSGSVYERTTSTTTNLITGSPTPVAAILASNSNTDTLDVLYANSTSQQITGLNSSLLFNALAS
jgi:hypothetical protein